MSVIGAGGLFGRHVVSEFRRRGPEVVTPRIPWGRPDDTIAALRRWVEQVDRSSATGTTWKMLWCAGAGVVATPQPALDDEVEVMESLLRALGERGPGSFFLASSAAVYAGSPVAPPFDEFTAPVPIAPYSEAKLRMEALVSDFSARTGSRVLIGRMATLYGPGQNPEKRQGLISTLCRAQITRQPAEVFVSLDTVRDYIFVTDAARMAVAAFERLASGSGSNVVKVIASGRAVSIGAVIGEASRVFRTRPPIVLRTTPATGLHSRDLRLRSMVWTDLDALARTTLPEGLAATRRSIEAEMIASRPWP